MTSSASPLPIMRAAIETVHVDEDLVEPLDGLGFFDLADEHGPLVLVPHHLPHFHQVVFASNEGEADEIHVLLQPHLEVRPVFLG